MKTDIKHIAAIAATAIWADGEYDEAEKIVLEEVADALELDAAVLATEVEAALAEIESKNEEQINDYILAHSVEVDDDEAAIMYQVALQIITIDGIVSVDEVDSALSIASALGINEAEAVLLFADLIREEPELKLEY